MKTLYEPRNRPMRVALFMSGTGSNAKKIIEAYIADRDVGNVFFEPVLVFSDNPDSNARRIAEEDYKDQGVVLPYMLNTLIRHSNLEGLMGTVARHVHDLKQALLMHVKHEVDCVALAGYDWLVSPLISDVFLTVNVHPGDLRVKKPNGKPAYAGLAWVPSAKAVLAGEKNVYTSVHQVTENLDSGPVLAVSEPVHVPENVACLEDRAVLLGEAKSVSEISRFIKEHPDIGSDELRSRFPIYGIAKDLQERLKVVGDWIVYPKVLLQIANGMYSIDGNRAYLLGKPAV